jgi:L-alanine-DL-glutamate epimerase-like enolase superfamily enzyme
MKIVRVECAVGRLELEEPYAIAYQQNAAAEVVYVRLVTDERWVGLGCAGPDPDVTGETADGVAGRIRDTIAPRLAGTDPTRWRGVLEPLEPAWRDAPAARAAIEMALYDVAAKRLGIPVTRLLGGMRDAIETSITIGILDEQATVRRARERIAQGFRILKIKGGRDWQEDAARLRRVREAVGPAIGLRFDANQGYSIGDTVRFLGATAGIDLELVEQPIAGGEPRQWRELAGCGPVPLMADESLRSIADGIQLSAACPGIEWNVKLMKVGGLVPAAALVECGAALGSAVMIGCMDEPALGIAAGLHLALALPGVRRADLDGHIGLVGDPTAAAVELRYGQLLASAEPGFGLVDFK